MLFEISENVFTTHMKFTKFLMVSAGAATMLFAHGSEPAADQLTKTTDSMN